MRFLASRPALLTTVVCLTLLASSTGFAQDSGNPPPAKPASEDEIVPPPLVPAEEPPARGELFPREQPQQEEEGPSSLTFGLRLFLQPPAGALLAGIAGYVSVFPTFLIVLPFCLGPIVEGPQSDGCDAALYTGMAVGAAFGASAGVTAVGHLLGGHARYWQTLVGALTGTALGGIAALTSDASMNAAIILLTVAPAVGATVAYTLSDAYSPSPRPAAARAGTGVSVLPVVSATRTGGIVGGLIGQF